MESTDALNALSKGISDLALVIPAYFSGEFVIVDVISLPFVASTSTRASAIAWRVYENTPEVQNAFADYKVISMWTAEPMYLHGAGRNYQTLDDFKGQKIRCSAGPSTDLINRLGGNAIIFSMVDAYINLQKGVVDAIVIPSESAMGSRTYEVAPYLTYFPGPATVHMMLMSRKVWDKMPVDIQQAIDSVSLETLSRLAGGVNDRARIDMVRKCREAGVALTEYDVPADEINRWLEKAGNPMRQAWVKAMSEKGVTNAQSILDEIISLSR
ncbi:MAG: TRAP transporter substrate-binding protein DctP, partial [Dehalococcoidales bacterium]|nr:TRAP transporter substrate-binding protein DctP [Dehalococcoidales bacterium]